MAAGLPKKYWRKMMMMKQKKKMMIISSNNNNIPHDVIFEILAWLPTMSVLRFRWVCKYWFNLIKDPDFVTIHHVNACTTNNNNNNNPLVLISTGPEDFCQPHTLQFRSLMKQTPQQQQQQQQQQQKKKKKKKYESDDDDDDDDYDGDVLVPVLDVKVPYSFDPSSDFSILGSCNGLLCISISRRREKIFVWNPCTKEYKKVSDASTNCIPIRKTAGITTYDTRGTNIYGFGYDCSIDDYKVIRNTCFYNNGHGQTLVDVYTLGVRGGGTSTNTWRKLRGGGGGGGGGGVNRFYLSNSVLDRGLFMNGHIYWMARSTGFDRLNMIVSFDIVKEEYREIPMPPNINPDKANSLNFRNLNGCLCLCVIYMTRELQSAVIWEMKKKKKHSDVVVGGGGDECYDYSWDKLHTIYARHGLSSFKPLKFCKNGEIAMVMEQRHAILYNPSNDIPTSYKQIRFLPQVCEMSSVYVQGYVDGLSLVSINSGTYNMGSRDHHHQPNKQTRRQTRRRRRHRRRS